MKFQLALALPALAAAAQYSKEDYVSGKVHQESMDRKMATWSRQRANGEMDSSKWSSWDKMGRKGSWNPKRDHVPCANGQAVVEKGNPLQTFACNNVRIGCPR